MPPGGCAFWAWFWLHLVVNIREAVQPGGFCVSGHLLLCHALGFCAVSADFRHLRHPGASSGDAGSGGLWLRYALQPGYGRHVPTGLPGPGDHHLVWNPPLPGDLHAPVALVGAAALLGLGAIGSPPSGSGIWVPKHHGVGSLAVPPGPDHGGVCLQRLFSPPAQPGVVPDRRPPGPDGLPEGRESPATGCRLALRRSGLWPGAAGSLCFSICSISQCWLGFWNYMCVFGDFPAPHHGGEIMGM